MFERSVLRDTSVPQMQPGSSPDCAVPMRGRKNPALTRPLTLTEGSPAGRRRNVLVVDDSPAQRRVIAAQLQTFGYAVRQAADGTEALAACRAEPPDFVISDWIMPGMDGPEFCRRFRAMARERYGYFLLLTAKSDRDEIAAGFEAGADDFLTKPVQGQELRARLAAGARVLEMEAELVEKNDLLRRTLDDLSAAQDALEKDLIEARKLQQSLIKERVRRFGKSQVSLLLRPAGHIGGDLVGFLPLGPDRLALYAIDVSGHGVASALLTARLSSYFATATPDRNIALTQGEAGTAQVLSPAQVAAELNRVSLAELETDAYFTMVYADVQLSTGEGRLVQAGHPHPVIQRGNGALERIGSGGLPIGLFDGADYRDTAFALAPGDRLIVTSDGITECETPQGQMLEEAGIDALLRRNAALCGQPFLEALTWDLADFAQSFEFDDDVSAILFEMG